MITAIYAAFAGLMLVWLSIKVIKARVKGGVAYGDGDNLAVRQAARAHGNFIEYTPLFLILLMFAEMHQLSIYAVHGLGLLFMAGRILHAYGLLYKETARADGGVDGSIKCRQKGMMLTFFTLVVASLMVAWLVISARVFV